MRLHNEWGEVFFRDEVCFQSGMFPQWVMFPIQCSNTEWSYRDTCTGQLYKTGGWIRWVSKSVSQWGWYFTKPIVVQFNPHYPVRISSLAFPHSLSRIQDPFRTHSVRTLLPTLLGGPPLPPLSRTNTRMTRCLWWHDDAWASIRLQDERWGYTIMDNGWGGRYTICLVQLGYTFEVTHWVGLIEDT